MGDKAGIAAVLDTPVELFYSMINGMQHGLLTRDALYLTIMDQNHIQNIASFDTDFDRVEYIMRWGI